MRREKTKPLELLALGAVSAQVALKSGQADMAALEPERESPGGPGSYGPGFGVETDSDPKTAPKNAPGGKPPGPPGKRVTAQRAQGNQSWARRNPVKLNRLPRVYQKR